jgi:DNA (cytosine-5)-methyltransferase 1
MCIETFSRNHKKAKAIFGDIRNLSSGDIRKLCGNHSVDIIIGGPPCQGFSMAGRRLPNDPRNSLFVEYLRMVKDLKPKIFLMENVIGLLSMRNLKNKRVIDIILNEFRKIGYHTNYYVINTADYGIPQKRKRVFIIGSRSRRYLLKFPAPTHSESGKQTKKWVSVEKIIEPKTSVEKRYFYSKKLIEGFKRRERENKKRDFGFGWKFIDLNKPCYTISARYYKDGADALIKYSNNSIRMLTPSECAKIQTFPASYEFSGSRKKIYEQIGNAVSPQIAFIIAKSIKNSIG